MVNNLPLWLDLFLGQALRITAIFFHNSADWIHNAISFLLFPFIIILVPAACGSWKVRREEPQCKNQSHLTFGFTAHLLDLLGLAVNLKKRKKGKGMLEVPALAVKLREWIAVPRSTFLWIWTANTKKEKKRRILLI